MSATDPVPTPGAKMQYLIRRRPTTSREELVVHWFANHMPLVIAAQQGQAEAGRLHATRYLATLFGAGDDGAHRWDGVAQLWWDQALPRPDIPHGTEPNDTFQQKVEPYVPWATTEYVIVDGTERLPVEPLTLNPPFPATRSGFHKVTGLVAAKPGADIDAFFAHWLDVHAPNVAAGLEKAGGFRYVISHSIDPGAEPYAGMAELYFPDADGWTRFREVTEPDGMDRWIDRETTLLLHSDTEMIGIP